MTRDFDKHAQVAHIPAVRLTFEHPVVLDDRVDVLDARADQLNPIIPRCLQRRKHVAISRLDPSEERRSRREMAIADVQLPRQLRVLEIGVLVDVRFVHHTYPTYPIDRDNSRGHFAMGRTHCKVAS